MDTCKKGPTTGKDFISCWFMRESERREKDESQEFPSKIYGVLSSKFVRPRTKVLRRDELSFNWARTRGL